MRVTTWESALAVACRAADRARQLVMARHAPDLEASFKQDGSPVTALDKSVELAIREEISAAFPGHSIGGEECPERKAGGRYAWIIDPIDGTVSMLNRIPTFATLIALCQDGLPVVSVVDLPALGERFTAVKGKGAWCGSGRLEVAPGFDWDKSIVCHGDRYTFDEAGYGRLFDALMARARYFRSYTDAYGHTLAARGSAALMVDSGMEPWDLAAPLLLVEEAGGKVAIYRDWNHSRRVLAVAGNRQAVGAVAELAQSLGFPSSARVPVFAYRSATV